MASVSVDVWNSINMSIVPIFSNSVKSSSARNLWRAAKVFVATRIINIG